ncbi:MAG: hypothetical protein R2769_15805 [Saprospiraceae bacterium]
MKQQQPNLKGKTWPQSRLRGEYEALPEKLKTEAFKLNYGKAVFNKKAGVTVVGARDFLIAYNINLNTTSVRRANSVAFDVREQGRVKRKVIYNRQK